MRSELVPVFPEVVGDGVDKGVVAGCVEDGWWSHHKERHVVLNLTLKGEQLYIKATVCVNW